MGLAARVARRARRALRPVQRVPADWLFDRRLVARVLRREHVLCLGDSHVRVLGSVRVPGAWFHAEPLSGATASGVLNPNSTTRSLEVFSARLDRAKRWQSILFQLGEVDCGFVIWHRAERHGISVDEQLDLTVASYAAFLARVAEMGFRRLVVLSAPLPTISDYPSQFAEVANARKEVTASMLDRTALTLRYNAALEARCRDIDAVFVDATTGHLGEAGLIDPAFLGETDRDHHLADKPYAALIADRLGRLSR